KGRVLLVERLGGTSHVHFDLDGGGSRMMASIANDRPPELGDAITFHIPPGRVHLFGPDGTTILRTSAT
ncbi:MAG: TOBE domain-containing protein, partial [Gemmatimonadales bacterium]